VSFVRSSSDFWVNRTSCHRPDLISLCNCGEKGRELTSRIPSCSWYKGPGCQRRLWNAYSCAYLSDPILKMCTQVSTQDFPQLAQGLTISFVPSVSSISISVRRGAVSSSRLADVKKMVMMVISPWAEATMTIRGADALDRSLLAGIYIDPDI
jgi:hypothetical protein